MLNINDILQAIMFQSECCYAWASSTWFYLTKWKVLCPHKCLHSKIETSKIHEPISLCWTLMKEQIFSVISVVLIFELLQVDVFYPLFYFDHGVIFRQIAA